MLEICICICPVCPSLFCPSKLCEILSVIILILHPEVAWKITVVVRARIGSIVPVHCSIAILTCAPKHCSRSLKIIRRLDGILQDGHRLEGLANAGIAHLAVLVTPVAVVHIVTHKVIHLLSRSVLSSSLARGCKCNETKFVHVTELLLHTSIVCKITVVYTLHPVVSTDAGRYVECI